MKSLPVAGLNVSYVDDIICWTNYAVNVHHVLSLNTVNILYTENRIPGYRCIIIEFGNVNKVRSLKFETKYSTLWHMTLKSNFNTKWICSTRFREWESNSKTTCSLFTTKSTYSLLGTVWIFVVYGVRYWVATRYTW